MAKAWKDVIASPQYQALAPEQKAQAQEQYFNEVVAPQAGENAEQAKQAFYAAYPLPSVQPVETQQPEAQQQPQQTGFMSDLGEAVKETGRGLVQAGVNVANIPASVADAVTSAAAWAGGKLGIGDGTYHPASRVWDGNEPCNNWRSGKLRTSYSRLRERAIQKCNAPNGKHTTRINSV